MPRAPLGPHSSLSRLQRADKRTRAGRFMAAFKEEIAADMGGEAQLSTAQRVLLDCASIKACRIGLLAERILGDEPSPENEKRFRAYATDLRRDLVALGLKRANGNAAGDMTLEAFVAEYGTDE